jgi:hypothetical protein
MMKLIESSIDLHEKNKNIYDLNKITALGNISLFFLNIKKSFFPYSLDLYQEK